MFLPALQAVTRNLKTCSRERVGLPKHSLCRLQGGLQTRPHCPSPSESELCPEIQNTALRLQQLPPPTMMRRRHRGLQAARELAPTRPSHLFPRRQAACLHTAPTPRGSSPEPSPPAPHPGPAPPPCQASDTQCPECTVRIAVTRPRGTECRHCPMGLLGQRQPRTSPCPR